MGSHAVTRGQVASAGMGCSVHGREKVDTDKQIKLLETNTTKTRITNQQGNLRSLLWI